MSRYRTVMVKIWNDPDFRSASEEGKLVFLNALTSPSSTQFGGYVVSKFALADEIGWEGLPERYRKGFQEGLAKGFFEYDQDNRFLYLPSFLKYNPPSNPNVLKSWGKSFAELPDCELKVKLYESLETAVSLKGKGFQEAFEEAFEKPLLKPSPKGSGNDSRRVPAQEQEQEQDQNKDQEQEAGTYGNGSGDDLEVNPDDLVDPNTWEPSKLEIDAVVAMGITDQQIQEWIPAYRLYLKKLVLKDRPMTHAGVLESFRRWCRTERPHAAIAAHELDQVNAEQKEKDEQAERKAKWLADHGFEDHEEYINFTSALSAYRRSVSYGQENPEQHLRHLRPELRDRALNELKEDGDE